jgi:hypothetical protein
MRPLLVVAFVVVFSHMLNVHSTGRPRLQLQSSFLCFFPFKTVCQAIFEWQTMPKVAAILHVRPLVRGAGRSSGRNIDTRRTTPPWLQHNILWLRRETMRIDNFSCFGDRVQPPPVFRRSHAKLAFPVALHNNQA